VNAELVPAPVVLVTVGEGATANIITIAWTSMVSDSPSMIGVSMMHSRHSYGLLCSLREFVVNIPRASDVVKVDVAGVVSGRNVAKFTEIGFTPLEASKVRPPLIAECPINLECALRHQLMLGKYDLFVGQVVASNYDEDVLDSGGRLKPTPDIGLTLVSMEYWTIGQKVGDFGHAGKEWRTLRRGLHEPRGHSASVGDGGRL
jgi:flavin reductase (DIM6/NTAB) family NADH-FMN oxidoreductase RutF